MVECGPYIVGACGSGRAVYWQPGLVRSLRNQVRERTGNLREEIAERKLAEVALRDSEASIIRWSIIFPSVSFRKDKQGRYVFVNSTFCELLGTACGASPGQKHFRNSRGTARKKNYHRRSESHGDPRAARIGRSVLRRVGHAA